MELSVIWNIVRNVLTLTLAVLVARKADNDFQVAVFLMALIGYHRILWTIARGRHDDANRGLISYAWFTKLDLSIRQEVPGDPQLQRMFRSLDEGARELVQTEEQLKHLARQHHRALWIFGATEVILMVSVGIVLLR